MRKRTVAVVVVGVVVGWVGGIMQSVWAYEEGEVVPGYVESEGGGV